MNSLDLNVASLRRTNDLIRHAIAAWGYLVPWGSRLALAEFAAAIRRHSANERAGVLAAALESATGFVARDWRGLRANWQSRVEQTPFGDLLSQ